VLDPFLGSGTTVMAAERCGRRTYAMELDPRYVETAIRRWQDHTGEMAVHAETRLGFHELRAAHDATAKSQTKEHVRLASRSATFKQAAHES
jgi:hypothetical protein